MSQPIRAKMQNQNKHVVQLDEQQDTKKNTDFDCDKK